jgi:hypothetical protein
MYLSMQQQWDWQISSCKPLEKPGREAAHRQLFRQITRHAFYSTSRNTYYWSTSIKHGWPQGSLDAPVQDLDTWRLPTQVTNK